MRLRNLILTLSAIAMVAGLATPAAAVEQRPVSPDAEFLVAAHQGNLTQIKAGKIALRKGGTATVRDLGRQLLTYHRRLDVAVQRAARKLDVSLPAAPNTEQKDLIRQYRAASATEFDTLFVGSQLLAHQRAIKLGKIVLATGTDPAVRKIVTAAVPVVRQHQDALVSAQQHIGDAAEQ
ncbi:DUF4142 domain-containing protein [Actinoplanes sp. NPDC024001]|uniref:DUF4142 domain-containing protein n=1 Tax=Actinoplanes sp. NPDC024001 TaxID=3154598 RepID=UPI00340A25E2